VEAGYRKASIAVARMLIAELDALVWYNVTDVSVVQSVGFHVYTYTYTYTA